MAYKGRNLYRKKGRGELSSDDFNYIQTQRRNINQQYSLGRAQNKFERNVARSDYRRNRGNVTTAWRARVPEFMSPYVEGGLLNSGLYRQGYDRFRQARGMELGDLLAAYQNKTGALRLADQQLASVRKSGLDDVSSLAAARRATVAEELRRARQGL